MGLIRGLLMVPGDNIGHLGPHEHLLRSLGQEAGTHWAGCRARQNAIALGGDPSAMKAMLEEAEEHVAQEAQVRELLGKLRRG